MQYWALSSAHTIPFEVPFEETGAVGPGNPKIFVELVFEVGDVESNPVVIVSKENARKGSLLANGS